MPIVEVYSFLVKIWVCKKTCNYSENLGGKTLKNPRISWVFPKSGTGGELIYSDFANRSSIKFSCENKSLQKNVQLFWKFGEKTPKNPRISWFFLKRGIGGELIYSDFANRWSMKFSCEKTGMKKNEQLFWRLGGKNSKKSKDFVSYPQKWNWGRINLFWFCQLLTYEVFWGK